MVLVDADRIEPAAGRVIQLIHEVVVHVVRAARVEQRRVDVHPHRRMLLTEVVRQLGVRHQVEPHEFHALGASSGFSAKIVTQQRHRRPRWRPGHSGSRGLALLRHSLVEFLAFTA